MSRIGVKIVESRQTDLGEFWKKKAEARSRKNDGAQRHPYFKGTNVKSWETYPGDLDLKPPYIKGPMLKNEAAGFGSSQALFSSFSVSSSSSNSSPRVCSQDSLHGQLKLSASTLGKGGDLWFWLFLIVIVVGAKKQSLFSILAF